MPPVRLELAPLLLLLLPSSPLLLVFAYPCCSVCCCPCCGYCCCCPCRCYGCCLCGCWRRRWRWREWYCRCHRGRHCRWRRLRWKLLLLCPLALPWGVCGAGVRNMPVGPTETTRLNGLPLGTFIAPVPVPVAKPASRGPEVNVGTLRFGFAFIGINQVVIVCLLAAMVLLQQLLNPVNLAPHVVAHEVLEDLAPRLGIAGPRMRIGAVAVRP